MKFTSVIIAAATLFSSSAFAGKFNCGVFLDEDDKPTATAIFDTSSGTRTTMQAGDFVGFVQVNKKADEMADESILLIGAVAKDKTVSLAGYPMISEMMVSLLKVSSGKQAITTCVAGSAELIRPAGI